MRHEAEQRIGLAAEIDEILHAVYPIRDWEQPGLDNAIKAAEDYLAKKPKPEKS